MRLISYVKNPIGYRQSDGREYITVDAVESPKAVFKGIGILYSWVQQVGKGAALNCQLDTRQMTPAECLNDQSGKISVELDAQSRTPVSGIRTSTGEGYIISPILELDPTKGQPIIMMILAPRTLPFNLDVEKSLLALPQDESVVTVTSEAGEVKCSGTISGQTRTAHIILNRNPKAPIYREGFDMILAELKGQGQISANWRPVTRTFEDHLLAFYPSIMDSNRLFLGLGPINLNAVANFLGGPRWGSPANSRIM